MLMLLRVEDISLMMMLLLLLMMMSLMSDWDDM